jgi:hypothetical protein
MARWISRLRSAKLRRRRRAGLRRGKGDPRRHAARPNPLEPLEPRLLLTTLTVNSALDNLTADDGAVTLREAIIAANTDGMTDLGETGSGLDQIVFDPALSSIPIVLSIAGAGEATGGLDITAALTITGAGAGLTTIDANGIDRTFHIVNAQVTFEDVTITGGNADRGGGVRATGSNLTLVRSTASGNTASQTGGGVVSDVFGNLQVEDSTISDNVVS